MILVEVVKATRVEMDATGGSKTEVAAKMIGAQLQSLLKIPPIKKHDVAQPSEPEHQPDVSNHREGNRESVADKFIVK